MPGQNVALHVADVLSALNVDRATTFDGVNLQRDWGKAQPCRNSFAVEESIIGGRPEELD